mmetsp:Transcript_3989/g.4621  ORF Transcript_3989/g.4621 Transcript_3989/m.4621 type:complete len:567 (-) Transcript_3989:194-1894(-)
MGNCGNKSTTESAVEPEIVGPNVTQNLFREQLNGQFNKHYTIEKQLGQGSMGAVSMIRKTGYNKSIQLSNRKITQGDPFLETGETSFALKEIIMDRVSDEFMEELRNEIEILKTMDHPNIVKAYETFEESKHIYLVMELCSGGDLYQRAPYSEIEAAKIIQKLLSAIKYMHNKGIVHRDLKFENIMFEDGRPNAQIKLIDFGLSKKFLPDEDHRMTDGVGTIYTMAPQVLQGVYTSRADLWSCGVIAYILLSSLKPFRHKNRKYVIHKIMMCDYNFRGERWKHISDQAKEFVCELIKLDPSQRWTATQALKSDFLSQSLDNLSERKPDLESVKEARGNMIAFTEAGDLNKLVSLVVAHKMSSNEIVDLRKIFSQFDKNNDGVLSLAEFQTALSESGVTQDESTSIFNDLDLNQTGSIDYTEFLASTIEKHGDIEEAKLADAFDQLDSDDTGFITRTNLRNMLGTQYTKEKVDAIFSEVDTDNDNKICYNEFISVFRKGVKGEAESIRVGNCHSSQSIRKGSCDSSQLGESQRELDVTLEDDELEITGEIVDIHHRVPGGKHEMKKM